jgi:hypothetical protein
MTVITRREFIRRTALGATALYECRSKVLADVQRNFEIREQKSLPLDSAAIRKLASNIVGRVITPDDSEYEAARLIFNRAFDLHPAVIVRCAGPSDVARALEFAQRQKVLLAVHGGGHSRLGYGSCDGGVVIDLSAMKRVEVDVAKRAARVEAGALARDLEETTQRFELATTSGGCPSVGIAGLTLGGGEGRLKAKYGLACDNLLSARVVTVDGRQIEASQQSNPDLFWAIRGGGGNFGVVTALEYQLHPVGKVLSGALTYPTAAISDLLQTFVRFLAEAPDELDAFAQVSRSERGPSLKIDLCYCGDPRMGSDLVRPLRVLNPQDDSVKVISYLEAQSSGGFLLAPVAHFQTNLILREFSEAPSRRLPRPSTMRRQRAS